MTRQRGVKRVPFRILRAVLQGGRMAFANVFAGPILIAGKAGDLQCLRDLPKPETGACSFHFGPSAGPLSGNPAEINRRGEEHRRHCAAPVQGHNKRQPISQANRSSVLIKTPNADSNKVAKIRNSMTTCAAGRKFMPKAPRQASAAQ
jgi:hypothetical protein